jgi:hypothetical protein
MWSGWTPDYILSLDMKMIAAMREQWDKFPPAHISIAVYLGTATNHNRDGIIYA